MTPQTRVLTDDERRAREEARQRDREHDEVMRRRRRVILTNTSRSVVDLDGVVLRADEARVVEADGYLVARAKGNVNVRVTELDAPDVGAFGLPSPEPAESALQRFEAAGKRLHLARRSLERAEEEWAGRRDIEARLVALDRHKPGESYDTDAAHVEAGKWKARRAELQGLLDEITEARAAAKRELDDASGAYDEARRATRELVLAYRKEVHMGATKARDELRAEAAEAAKALEAVLERIASLRAAYVACMVPHDSADKSLDLPRVEPLAVPDVEKVKKVLETL